MRKLILSAAVALLVTAGPALAQDSADNRGMVLFHAQANDNDNEVHTMIQVAPRVRPGHYKVLRGYTVAASLTSEAKLPPGDYAIVRVYSGRLFANADVYTRSDYTLEGPLLDYVFSKAIAYFTLKPREIVDIG